MANHSLALLLAAVTLIGGGRAQSRTPRARLGGYVHAKDGAPWADARVHLISRVVPGCEWIGEPDRIVVTSDARGRFAARILRDRDYLVWAVSAPNESVYRATHPLLGVRSGPLRLHEQVEPLVQAELRIVGDESWKRPFRAKLTSAPPRLAIGDRRVGDPYEVFELEVDARGEALVPLVPWRECTLELYDGRGVQIWVSTVVLARDARKAAIEKPRSTEPGDIHAHVSSVTRSVIRIPEPAERKLTVLDESGQPLADAELGQRVRGRYVVVGKTDARGVVTTQLPVRHEAHADRLYGLRGASRLVVRKRGYLEACAESSKNVSNRDPIQLGTSRESVLKMKRGAALTAQLLRNAETPLAGTPLIFYVRGIGQVHAPVLLSTDREGRFEVTQDFNQAWLLVAILDDKVRAELSRDDTRPVARVAILAAHGARQPSGSFDLSKLRRIDLDLRGADGSPSSFARVDGFYFSGFNAIPPMVQLRANRRGRLAILTAQCPRAVLVAHDEHGFAAREWDRLEDQTRLELGGVHTLSGIVQDESGRRVPGATVAPSRTFLRAAALRLRDDRPSSSVLNMYLFHRFRCETDDAGRFSLWVPATDTGSVAVSVTLPGKRQPEPEQMLELGGHSRNDVELVIR